MKRILVLFSFVLLSCGSSSNVHVRASVASNQSQNPFIKIQNDYLSGASRGIYFRLDALKCPPSSIDDVNSSISSVITPDETTQTGFGGTQTSFDIGGSSLQPNTYYKITMYARASDGTITHTGVSDCPVNTGLKGNNDVVICFGDVLQTGGVPLCGGTTAFPKCPGVADGTCF